MGFTRVFRYTGGIADWLANGMPVEGRGRDTTAAGHLARRDVPTCRPGERAGEVWRRVQAAGWETCVVVNEYGVVFGLLGAEASGRDGETLVEKLMQSSPRTYRHDAALGRVLEDMQRDGSRYAVITSSSGHLIGLLRRADAEQAVQTGLAALVACACE